MESYEAQLDTKVLFRELLSQRQDQVDQENVLNEAALNEHALVLQITVLS